MISNTSQRGLTITNPLVLYRTLLATNRIQQDPAQYRLALHLQRLYERLKDYEPAVEYAYLLDQINRTSRAKQPSTKLEGKVDSASKLSGVWASLKIEREKRDTLALTRVLTNHESAAAIDSPKGLMLHGEVGTGKSMLIDLFAECLPTKKKRRWHFNTFMLDIFAKLETLRKTHSSDLSNEIHSPSRNDYSLLWLARDLIQTSPVLFLDEFQLPDRATSKIMTNLMTSFFQLGGVLIATSNRMPEELANAVGIELRHPPSRLDALGWRLGLGLARQGRSITPQASEFAAFLDLLKARCEVWEMQGHKDYRRSQDDGLNSGQGNRESQIYVGITAAPGSMGDGRDIDLNTVVQEPHAVELAKSPKFYLVKPVDTSLSHRQADWEAKHTLVMQQATKHTGNIPWTPSTIHVYGRALIVPRQYNDVSKWTFDELCGSRLGPADYVSIASTFHTIILDDVPVLTVYQKNEARRLITLLDALYESSCKLVISATAGPDDIFFPEKKPAITLSSNDSERSATTKKTHITTHVEESPSDALHSETFAEAFQDAVSPFRPNISSYEGAGLSLSEDALEDDPPNRARRMGRAFSEEEYSKEQKSQPDFSRVGVFTGEDEKFAYKRARSRLWEMCGDKWWMREEEGWWKPLPKESRGWEVSSLSSPVKQDIPKEIDSRASNRQEEMFRHGGSPFRTHAEPPPKINWTHIWGTMKWGKRAGAWGKGVEGLGERKGRKNTGNDQ